MRHSFELTLKEVPCDHQCDKCNKDRCLGCHFAKQTSCSEIRRKNPRCDDRNKKICYIWVHTPLTLKEQKEHLQCIRKLCLCCLQDNMELNSCLIHIKGVIEELEN